MIPRMRSRNSTFSVPGFCQVFKWASGYMVNGIYMVRIWKGEKDIFGGDGDDGKV